VAIDKNSTEKKNTASYKIFDVKKVIRRITQTEKDDIILNNKTVKIVIPESIEESESSKDLKLKTSSRGSLRDVSKSNSSSRMQTRDFKATIRDAVDKLMQVNEDKNENENEKPNVAEKKKEIVVPKIDTKQLNIDSDLQTPKVISDFSREDNILPIEHEKEEIVTNETVITSPQEEIVEKGEPEIKTSDIGNTEETLPTETK